MAGLFAAQRTQLHQQLLFQLLYFERQIVRAVRGNARADRDPRGGLALQHAQRAQQFIGRGHLQRTAQRNGAAVDRAAACAEQGAQRLQQFGARVFRKEAFGRFVRLDGIGGVACRCRAGAALLSIARQLVTQLRQHASAHQFVADFLVKLVQRSHHVAIEQLVDDQLDAHVRGQLAHRMAKCLGQRRGADRIVGIVDLDAAVDHRQTLVHGEQLARQARFVLADHAGDGQRFFQFVVGNQRQFHRTDR
jgi:hypothetical protein